MYCSFANTLQNSLLHSDLRDEIISIIKPLSTRAVLFVKIVDKSYRKKYNVGSCFLGGYKNEKTNSINHSGIVADVQLSGNDKYHRKC